VNRASLLQHGNQDPHRRCNASASRHRRGFHSRYHSLSTSQIDHPQISLGGGVKANTLCNGNDARRTRKSRQPASALRTNVAGAKSVEGAAR
jgi:hypothetical protein